MGGGWPSLMFIRLYGQAMPGFEFRGYMGNIQFRELIVNTVRVLAIKLISIPDDDWYW